MNQLTSLSSLADSASVDAIDGTPPLPQTMPSSSLPGGQIISLRTALEQKAEYERTAAALKKMEEKCPEITPHDVQQIAAFFVKDLYMKGLRPGQWYKQALVIVENVLGAVFGEIAEKIGQILFVSSRFHFHEAPRPEILGYYEIGEEITESIKDAKPLPEDHTLHDIPAYLNNRLGSTLIGLMTDPAVAIEIFLGPREDMLAYYRSREPPSTLRGELDSPTSTEFYLFESASKSPIIVITGISNRSRFYHQLWQLSYSGVDLARVTTRGSLAATVKPQVEALRRELARLPVKPTIAVIGQRWWPMEVLGRMAGIVGREGEAYTRLQPTNLRIGPFMLDYLIASCAGAPPTRNKVGLVALRMPYGSLAGAAMEVLIDNGTTHVLFAGAGGSLDPRAEIGAYQPFTEATYGSQRHSLPPSSVFRPRLEADFPLLELGRNITVDSPLEESMRWLEESRASRHTSVDVESAHLLAVLATAAARNPGIRVTPGIFISDLVGSENSLAEKISTENAYAHLAALLAGYFSQIGIDGVYDAEGGLHSFLSMDIEARPALVACAQAVPDAARASILGVRFDSEDFCILAAPKRKVDYPDFQAMGAHKQILYVIAPAAAEIARLVALLKGSDPAKVFLVFPADIAQHDIELANHYGYETIVIVEPNSTSFSRADYIISRDSGWGTYETVVAMNARAVVVLGDPDGFRELLIAMENRDRGIFVLKRWEGSAVLQELDSFNVFEESNIAAQLKRVLNLGKLEKWVARVRPDIEIVPLSGVRGYGGERKIIGLSGSSKIAQFDLRATESMLRELLLHLDPKEVMFGTGGTDYGVEEVLHRLLREEFPAFGVIGFITNEGRGDKLGTPAITVAGNDWYGKSVPFLNSIDFLITVAGGGVIHQELLMAYRAELPLFPLAGSGMKTDEFLRTHPDVPRYHSGEEIARAIERGMRGQHAH